jgi:arsenate reductase (thioredoxin)
MKKILVLCTGNSCRSQIAEGWIKYYAGNEARVYSAGIEAYGLNKEAVRSMADALIDISGHKSKTVSELPENEFDYIITLCDNAREKCPDFPGKTLHLHRSFSDPSSFSGSEEEVRHKYDELRDQIEDYCFDFVHSNIRPLVPGELDDLIRF